MNGRARARCGVSVVSGLATGRGAAVAVDLFVEARVTLREGSPEVVVRIEPEADEDPTLARLAVRRVLDRLGHPDLGAEVVTRSDVPTSMGLKTSSAAANAVAAATNAAAQRYEGEALAVRDLVLLGVDAALAAKVTVTGAFDDASASARGGLCVADNRARQLLARHEMPALTAVILLAGRKIRKSEAGQVDYRHLAPAAAIAHELALANRWQEAMTLNGLAYASVIPVDAASHRAAMAAGASAVSVSGTGPAVAALCPPEAAKAVEAALAAFGRTLTAPVSNAPLEVLA